MTAKSIPYLYIVLLGCDLKGRHTEQHDVFFGAGPNLHSLKGDMEDFWPEAEGLHIDGFIKVDRVGQYKIEVISDEEATHETVNLYFINLGGYEQGELDEKHQRLLIVAESMAEALRKAKQHPFYQEGAEVGNNGRPHVDDRYELKMEVDEVINLSEKMEGQGYRLRITDTGDHAQPKAVPGYIKLENLAKLGF
jgi:hypothetical protein